MDVTIRTLSDIQQEAEIQVTNEELQPHFDRAYEKYRTKVELKGFRKGKVPLDMVKRLYGEAIEHDSLDELATEFYRQAMTEKDIHPLGQPTMTDMDFQRGTHFRFTIKYEVKPPIKLKKYKGIEVEKPVRPVTDEDVDKEIESIRRTNSTTSEVPKVTDNQHIVTGDVQELDDTGTPLIGKKSTGTKFYLADETLVKEIRDALAAAEPGGSYRVTFESRHEDHTHTVNILITVKTIERVELPAFDDAFAEKVTGGKTSTATVLRQNIKQDLEKFWAEKGNEALEDAIARELVGAHDFAVPDTLVNSFLDAFVDDIRRRSKDRSLPANFDEQKFRNDSREYATWQAKWMLLKERIGEEEQFSVTDDDLGRLADEDSSRTGIDKERLLEYYKQSPSTSERLLSRKTMDFLKGHAKVREKVIEQPATA